MVGLVIRANSAVGIFPDPESFDYYIGPSGSDSNNGLTTSTPWAISSLNNAGKRTLYAGKRVGLLDGTYNLVDNFGTPSSLAWSDNVVEVKGGSAGVPTVIKAVNRHLAIIHGQHASLSDTGGEGGLIGPLDDNVTLDGLKIVEGNYSAVSNFNCDNFTLQNCWIDEHRAQEDFDNSASILFRVVNDALIRNCKITNSSGGPNNNRHDYILVYCDANGNSNGVIVEYTSVTVEPGGDGGNGIYFKWAANSNKNITIRYCAIDRSGASGVGTNYGLLVSASASSADYARIYGNIIDGGSGRPSILFIQQGHNGEASVYNNTLVSASGTTEGMGVLTIAANSFDPSPINYYNNIHSRAGIGFNGDVRFTSVAALNNVDYNCYDTSPAMAMIIPGQTTQTTLAGWRTLTGKEANSITTTNPLFVGSGNFAASYALQAGSPAKITGFNGATELGAYGADGYDGLGIGYSDARE